ncbi:hypothetical protein [Pseudomonas serbica]|uniref:hypothetical protein n=1 Tax=Pseudomonas serbica TaxID=2965074 RepID=UPI00237B7E75|nr:hypothetical protein [Pseudomonas serbica]
MINGLLGAASCGSLPVAWKSIICFGWRRRWFSVFESIIFCPLPFGQYAASTWVTANMPEKVHQKTRKKEHA